jgi:hypothetical protein
VKGKEQNGVWTLVLEHWAKATPRDFRYLEAFERVRTFVESHAYTVEIGGS